MSEFHVRVVKIGEIVRHDNADTLSITMVDGGYPVIFRTGEFQTGDLAVYIPVDSIVPDEPQWAFLKGHRRIKAKKLRGVFSMGMLTKLPEGSFQEGDNLQELLKIEKWDPFVYTKRMFTGQSISSPQAFPVYTDLDSLRKFSRLIVENEEVILTEKIHGANARYGWHDGQFWAGSHRHFKKPIHLEGLAPDMWWKAALELNLEEKMKSRPELGFYGEVYGQVQDLKYGLTGLDVRFFDILDLKTQKYLDYDDAQKIFDELGLKTVPVLYRGPWTNELRSLAEGMSTLPDAYHVREGFVLRPVKERHDLRCGRVILKFVGEGYLLRKE